MRMMQIVIDIPKEIVEWINKYSDYIKIFNDGKMGVVVDAIKNGTPLPKGHGRLIDADAFAKKLEYASKRQKYKELLVKDLLTVDDVFEAVIESLKNEGLAEGDAPTIIEADRTESGVEE